MLVGVAQIEPELGQPERNLDACLGSIEAASTSGCSLVVLPECASAGYVFDSADEAMRHAQEIPGPFTAALVEACARGEIHCVAGMLERDGDLIRNTAVVVGSGGLVGRYRKSHLPFLGVDRFVTPGDELEVLDTPIGRIGVEICYDLRFPELTRALALRGAEIVALPTNWPLEARTNAELLTRARAYENRIFLLVANRVGREGDVEFCGWSQICDIHGVRVAEADGAEKRLLVAEIEVDEARQKEIVPSQGTYEMSLFGHRRPELYGALVADTASVT
jgi:predicted amidohydrolase